MTSKNTASSKYKCRTTFRSVKQTSHAIFWNDSTQISFSKSFSVVILFWNDLSCCDRLFVSYCVLNHLRFNAREYTSTTIVALYMVFYIWYHGIPTTWNILYCTNFSGDTQVNHYCHHHFTILQSQSQHNASNYRSSLRHWILYNKISESW